jgi:hypothetical protein
VLLMVKFSYLEAFREQPVLEGVLFSVLEGFREQSVRAEGVVLFSGGLQAASHTWIFPLSTSH